MPIHSAVFIPATGRRTKTVGLLFGTAHARNQAGTLTIPGRTGQRIKVLEVVAYYEDDVAGAAVTFTHGAIVRFSEVIGTNLIYEGTGPNSPTGVVLIPPEAAEAPFGTNFVISMTTSGSAAIGAFLLARYEYA